MKAWSNRSNEVAYLLNPAFCGRILYTTIKKYNEESKRSLPFPLVYLILPLILHKVTREKISSRTKLLAWVHKNPELLIDFSDRANDLVKITNEAIELLLQTKTIVLTEEAGLEINNTIRGLKKSKFTDDEISKCLNKSEHVAKWFASSGKVETIFISLGVRP
ncbi:TPA: hypothetical protein LEN89_002612 [Listeria monocytogenes]|nr:hypothetical protein [Listeria monocytogenes]HBJ9019876.1 hypothetical protein [Listeria monocytogenes]HBJ9024460.1 hypothetical protein [Listeria monocytogenes]HBK0076229.1 hypothetical protein [Listeria monocytogenes]